MEYCYHCMSPLNGQWYCPACGQTNAAATFLPHQLPPGTILEGRYLLGRVLGKGAFGITYIGMDLRLNMKIAVKEYFPSVCSTRSSMVSPWVTMDVSMPYYAIEGKIKFLQEAQSLARFIYTDGIVNVHDYFEDNGTAYIVMQYLEGQTLKEALLYRTFSPNEIFGLMLPVMDALQDVHEQGLIHRDISPDNLMLLPDNHLVLMDFGAAREYSLIDPRSVTIMVKHGYAPEEQYRAHGETGPWTDVYALCATIYHCLTGVLPQDANERVYHDELLPPSAFGIKLTRAQESALKRGMAIDAKKRIQSMDDLRASLKLKSAPAAPDDYWDIPQQPAYEPQPERPVNGPSAKVQKLRSSEPAAEKKQAAPEQAPRKNTAAAAPRREQVQTNTGSAWKTVPNQSSKPSASSESNEKKARAAADTSYARQQAGRRTDYTAQKPHTPVNEVKTSDWKSHAASSFSATEKRVKKAIETKSHSLFELIKSADRLRLGILVGTLAALILAWPFGTILGNMVSGRSNDNISEADIANVSFPLLEDADPDEEAYLHGQKLLATGDYAGAVQVFSDLGNYRDSKDQATEARYLQAEELFKNEQYEKASDLFTKLGDYADSEEMVQNCLYQQALRLYRDGAYNGAIALLSDLSGNQCEQLKNICRYMKARRLHFSGDEEGAIGFFMGLGEFSPSDLPEELLPAGYDPEDYPDAPVMVMECHYQQAVAFYDSENYEEAFRVLKSLSGYGNSAELLEKVKEKLYEEAIDLYKSATEDIKAGQRNFSKYDEIKSKFERLSDYENAGEYLIILDAYYQKGDDYDNYKNLLNRLQRSGAQYLLLTTNPIHFPYYRYFLKGTWETADGSYYFRLYEEDDRLFSPFTLPHSVYGEHFFLNDGIYSLGETYETSTNCFKFTIVDSKTMECYCYSNGKTYTLYWHS